MSFNGRKKILFITDIFSTMAGSERNITQLMTNIDRKRFQIMVACFISGKLAQDMRDQGFSVFDLQSGGIYTIRGIKNLAFLRKLIHKEKISLIVSYHESSDFYGLVLSNICRVPVISSRRDMGYKAKFHHRIAYRFCGRFFDAVITVCHAVKNEVIDRGWFSVNKVFPIYNGVNIREFDNKQNIELLKKKNGIETKQPVVGVIAGLRKIKGIKYFIEAASVISKRNPEVVFLIIGPDLREPGCTKEELELVARNLNVSNNVHFIGRRDDVADLISIFDVAVVSSLSEGFSNVILEYMASSKSVVATNVGGNPEAVVDGETGLLVPPGDSLSLADAIWSILINKDMGIRLGIAGRERVEEKFSLEKMIINYEHLFEQVILDKNVISTEL
ncbi:MAG: glycosyltransferase family 4 protein [Nitrospirota bacterium]|nr:glycosyltransferase family 4 protein [Nitrospirota bacterium]